MLCNRQNPNSGVFGARRVFAPLSPSSALIIHKVAGIEKIESEFAGFAGRRRLVF
jgi:hypothetical protein